MGTTLGTETPGVMQSLLATELAQDACSFEFFQAVSLLERILRDRRPVGWFSSPDDETLRFHANPHLAFPASEIQELKLNEDAPGEMMVNFMGLTGPSGVLPHPYSELILERMRAKDGGLAAFLNIFNHRAISLFYRAWQRPRLAVSYGTGARDVFTEYLRDLIGIGTGGLSERQEIEDEGLIHYVALVGMQGRSAVALEQLLADYFEVPVVIEQFTGAWYPLDGSTQCAMGEKENISCEVGGGAIVGDAIWERQGRARIRIGPLTMLQYEDFLPQGRAYASLRAITRFFTNDTVDFEVQLVLDRREVPGVDLDLSASRPARLGWISWTATRPMAADPDDAILAL